MRDSKYEAWLEHRGVPFDYVESISLGDIHVDDEVKFNIRLTTELDEDQILRYGIALEQGDTFPAIVVFRQDGKFGLINGLHRTEAFKLAGRDSVDAYVVKVDDPKIIDTLRRTANVTEGLSMSMSSAVQHAVHLVRSGRYGASDAARLMGVPRRKVDVELRILVTQEDLTRRKVDTANLTRSTLHELHPLIKRPALIDRLATLAAKARLGVEEVRTMSQQLRDAPSDEVALRRLGQYEEEHAPQIAQAAGGLTHRPQSVYAKLPDALHRTERVLAEAEGDTSLLSAEQMRTLAARLREIAKRLQREAATLEKAAHAAA